MSETAGTSYFIFLFVIRVGIIVACIYIGKKKNRMGLVYGLFLGMIGLIIFSIIPPASTPAKTKPVPARDNITSIPDEQAIVSPDDGSDENDFPAAIVHTSRYVKCNNCGLMFNTEFDGNRPEGKQKCPSCGIKLNRSTIQLI